MEQLIEQSWKYVICGSVFTLSMLIGHFSIQDKVNAYLRVVAVSFWLFFIAWLGAGELWLMNVMAFLWLWTIHLTVQEYWKKRKFDKDPNPLLRPPRLQKLVLCGAIFFGLLVAGFVIGLRNQWSWSQTYSAAHDVLLAGVVYPIVFPLLYYLHRAAFASPQSLLRRTLFLAASVGCGFAVVGTAKELLGIFAMKEPLLEWMTYAIFLAAFTLQHFSDTRVTLAKTSFAVVLALLITVVGIFSSQLLAAKKIALSPAPPLVESNSVEALPGSPGFREKIDGWQAALADWSSGTIVGSPEIKRAALVKRYDYLARLRKIGAPGDYRNKLVNAWFRSTAWQGSVEYLLGDSWKVDRECEIVLIHHGRFVAFVGLEQIRIASQIAEIDHGKMPSSLDELRSMTKLLIWWDPFSENQFKESTRDGKWFVYSIGEDQKDDGGAELVNTGVIRTYDLSAQTFVGDIGIVIE